MENIKGREQLNSDQLFYQLQGIHDCLQIVYRLKEKDTFADPIEPYKLLDKLYQRQIELSTLYLKSQKQQCINLNTDQRVGLV